MKKPILTFTLHCLAIFSGVAQTTTENYIKTETMLNAEGSVKIASVQYYDQLGREALTVQNGINSTTSRTNTVVQEYDAAGRPLRTWLPITRGTLGYSSSVTSLASDPAAFSQYAYDALDRPIFVSTPGTDLEGRGKSTEYTTNTANSVKKYKATDSGLSQDGYYPAGTLNGEKTTDEDGRTVEVFKDMLGAIVLERRASSNDTYYVYDSKHQLRFVLSPQYQASSHKSIFGYEYRYDERGNMVKKILPQCEYIQYWYDETDKLTFMQDATLRSKEKYRFFLYDSLGRVAVQGLSTIAKRSLSGVDYTPIAVFNSSNAGIGGSGYTIEVQGLIDAYPIIEVVNYYDDYGFLAGVLQGQFSFASSPTLSAKGLQTGAKVRASNGTMLYQVMYYNERGLLTDTKSTGLNSRREYSTVQYSFTNKPKVSTYKVTQGSQQLLSVTTTNAYYSNCDKLFRTNISITSKNASGSAATAQYSYDDLGRIGSVTRSANAGSIQYGYDIRGWTKSITTPDFAEELFYADNQLGTPCYNGNVSTLRWKDAGYKPNHSDMKYRGYRFNYDELNRMTAALYGEGENLQTNENRYNEIIDLYDDNGNIRELTRRGLKQDGVYGTIDNLSIHLDGNQIREVKDVANRVIRPNMLDFDNGNNGEWYQYTYNSNGALVSDENRGIAMIQYDDNNNPLRIQFTNGNVTRYVYSALGAKLRTIHYTAVPNITVPIGSTRTLTMGLNGDVLSADTTDYLVGLLLENGQPSKYLFDGGYCTLRNASGNASVAFHYFYRDHLGNNRVVVNAATGNVEQVTNYYPFGAVFGDSTTLNPGVQKYKYNNKELDLVHGLKTYDYGARQLNPIVPSWDRIDPMAEKYYHISPYAYCVNNPVNTIDLDGKIPTDREAAIISQHIYNGKVELEGGWDLYGERQQMKNGLTFGVYCRENTNGDVEYVLAFGGTSESLDFGSDIKQAMGLPDSQYGMAKELGEKFNNLYDGYEKTIVGHSLGGGLSQVASMATGINTITFNSAAVHRNTKVALGLTNAPTDQIKNIIVRGDIVTSAQDLSIYVNSGLNLEGQRKYIGTRQRNYSVIKQFTNHLIQTVIDILKK